MFVIHFRCINPTSKESAASETISTATTKITKTIGLSGTQCTHTLYSTVKDKAWAEVTTIKMEKQFILIMNDFVKNLFAAVPPFSVRSL